MDLDVRIDRALTSFLVAGFIVASMSLIFLCYGSIADDTIVLSLCLCKKQTTKELWAHTGLRHLEFFLLQW